jgi:hypothetical protein
MLRGVKNILIGLHPLNATDYHTRPNLPDDLKEADGTHVLELSVPGYLRKRG